MNLTLKAAFLCFLGLFGAVSAGRMARRPRFLVYGWGIVACWLALTLGLVVFELDTAGRILCPGGVFPELYLLIGSIIIVPTSFNRKIKMCGGECPLEY